MQQFVVPQFIDVESKIFGPVTTRQFVILLGAGGIIFLAYRFGDFAMFITTFALVGGFALLFAFFKPNGQVFHIFLLNIIQSLKKPGLRVWRKEYSTDELNILRQPFTPKEKDELDRKVVKRERIRDLSLQVNTGGYYQPDSTE